MTRIVLITDSAACIPPPLVEEFGIHIVPLTLVLDGKSYPDRADGDNRQFYEHLKSARQPPTTSSPPPGEYTSSRRPSFMTSRSTLLGTQRQNPMMTSWPE